MRKEKLEDYISQILGVVLLGIFVLSVVTFFVYSSRIDREIFPSDVNELDGWVWITEDGSEVPVEFPEKVSVSDGVTVIFRNTLPDDISEGVYLALTNVADFSLEIDGIVREEWYRDEVDIPGGPSKGSTFFIPLTANDCGKTVTIIKSGPHNNGRMNKVFYGDSFGLVRKLELDLGVINMLLGILVLVLAVIVIAIGFVLRYIYRARINMIYLGFGVLIAAAWEVVTSTSIQLVFGVKYIDGVVSYMMCLLMIFPFAYYLNELQHRRYQLLYTVIELFELVGLIVFCFLHFSRIRNFGDNLLIIDIVVGLGALAVFGIVMYDVLKKRHKSYSIVTYGFIVFIILIGIELIYINTSNRPTVGVFIMFGLIVLLFFAGAQQIRDLSITVRKRTAAREADKAKTEFLSNMSHEIRTPINAILGMSEILSKRGEKADVEECSQRISEAGNRLLVIVDDLLDFTKFQNGDSQIEEERYNVRELITKISDDLRREAEKKNLGVVINILGKIPGELVGDYKHIYRVLKNVTSNAVKYTEEGRITLAAECVENGKGYSLNFFVKDTGCGIQKHDLDRIFDPFARSDIAKNRSIHGTGLGLALAKILVDEMGGSISVESIYEKGSTFTIKFPQEKSENESDATPLIVNSVVRESTNDGVILKKDNIVFEVKETENDRRKGYSIEKDLEGVSDSYTAENAKILLVDDNMSNLTVAEEFLKSINASVDTATGGSQAYSKTKANKYDIILMDHMMPDPDGVETLHNIRNDVLNYNRDIPVIVITANAVPGCRDRYLEEGFTNYLSKPIESSTLLRMVRKYLPEELITEKVSDKKPETGMKIPEDNGPIDFVTLAERFDNKYSTIFIVLSECVKEGERKIELLRNLLDNEDIPRYAIETHGIKGVMASICADEFSAHAKQHEFAGKEGRIDFIKEDFDTFVSEYRELLKYIEDFLDYNGIIVERSAKSRLAGQKNVSELEKTVAEIEEALDDFDADRALKNVEVLESLVGNDKIEIVEAVRRYTDEFEYNEAKEELRKLL